MTTVKANVKPRIVDNTAIPELYANKVVSTAFDGGAVTLTFGVTRMMPDRVDDVPDPSRMPTPTVHVSARLALSPPAAIELINAISGVLNAAQLAQIQAMQHQQGGNFPPGAKVAN